MEEAIRPLVESLPFQYSPPYIYEGMWEEEQESHGSAIQSTEEADECASSARMNSISL